jgi:hypothetical protein
LDIRLSEDGAILVHRTLGRVEDRYFLDPPAESRQAKKHDLKEKSAHLPEWPNGEKSVDPVS